MNAGRSPRPAAGLGRFCTLAAAAALALGLGGDAGDAWRAAAAEREARTMEGLALSSVAGPVPGRAMVRRAQAVAIVEARRLGLDLSIASVGSGGAKAGDSADDDRTFARLAERFPYTIRAALERDAHRERLSKARRPGVDAPGDYNGTSQLIVDRRWSASACVVELRAPGESLRGMLAMTFDESATDAIERLARRLGIGAGDVAFLVAAHESAHCVIGMARRAGLLDTGWADPAWQVPPSWVAGRTRDDRDAPALAKAEESAADLLAVLWAAQALGTHKARHLARLSAYAVALGARPPGNDALHDSSRVLAGLLARRPLASTFKVGDRTRFAWEMAVAETRAEVGR